MSNSTSQDLIQHLKIGTRVSATFDFGPSDTHAIHAHYVGMKQDEFLVFSLSKSTVESLTLRKVDNCDIIIRAITDTELAHIIAFKTSVKCLLSRPAHMLFLRPPASIATKPVREHERYKVNVDCELISQSVTYQGKLVDFSIAGCGIYLEEDPELNSKSDITISSMLNEFLPEGTHYQAVRTIKKGKGWLIGIKYKENIEMSLDLKREVLEQAFFAGSL
ncbi:flagellar brake protein [Vibrio makurazakiensis]|uniref:PilZ domain-containing protein n=1 Tax=Vibrio makurazakiensis TaxID=2910250 RepID=UPI003D0CFA5C